MLRTSCSTFVGSQVGVGCCISNVCRDAMQWMRLPRLCYVSVAGRVQAVCCCKLL